jgi:Flp pilus assembly protein TadB
VNNARQEVLALLSRNRAAEAQSSAEVKAPEPVIEREPDLLDGVQAAKFVPAHGFRWVLVALRFALAIALAVAIIPPLLGHAWLLALAFGVAAMIAFPRWPAGRWVGKCPHCLNNIWIKIRRADVPVGINCPLCARRLVASGAQFKAY